MDHDRAISDYGVIGNLHTAALVSSGGSIDWACLPHFDSPAFFCRLLDINVGGYFQIHPVGVYKVERAYLERSNILSTTFSNGFGKVRLIDLMPTSADEDEPQEILRKVEGVEGEIDLEVVFRPTPQFAKGTPALSSRANGLWVEGSEPFAVLFTVGSAGLLQAIGWRIENGRAETTVRVKAGEALYFLLSYHHGKNEEAAAENNVSLEGMEGRISRTLDYWQAWAEKCRYHGPYRNAVLRSALTLKLLTFAPTGGIVAAATTSLPEALGGVRNWDYRFAWLRDSALILYSLMELGYQEEAHAFMKMMMRTCLESCAKGEPLQIMYRIDGESELPEQRLSHLEGYRKSQPVRIGNAAAKQLQLDVFGELLNCLYTHHQWKDHPPQTEQEKEDLLCLVEHVGNFVVPHWRKPDHGIWEFRDQPRHFVYSKVMSWVALDRAIKLAEQQKLKVETQKWKEVREEIRRTVLEKGYHPKLGSFVQAFDETALDASALLFPILGFIAPDDPKMLSTVRKIQQALRSRHFTYRYIMEDGLPGREGAFLACSFWLVDALTLMGRVEEAEAEFERLLAAANDLGLYAEEIDPITEEALGNFPQAFTHVALINAAMNLEKAKRGAQRKNLSEEAAKEGSYDEDRK